MEQYRLPDPKTVIHEVSGASEDAPVTDGNRTPTMYASDERARHIGEASVVTSRGREATELVVRERCDIAYAKGKEGEIRGTRVAGVMTRLDVAETAEGLDVTIGALEMTATSSGRAAEKSGVGQDHRFDVRYGAEAWGILGRHSVDSDENRITVDLFVDGPSAAPDGEAVLESAIIATYLQGLIAGNAGEINSGEYVVALTVLYHAGEFAPDPQTSRAVVISQELDIALLADPEFPGEVDYHRVQDQVFGAPTGAHLQTAA